MDKNKKYRIKQGDIFIISDVTIEDESILALDKKIRLGKVVFSSKITRQMIGMIISCDVFDEAPSEISNIRFIDKIFYTGNQLLRSGEWQIIGNQNVKENEENLTIRLTGSTLRKMDIDLGVVSHQDRKKYKQQSIEGFGLLYKNLNEL